MAKYYNNKSLFKFSLPGKYRTKTFSPLKHSGVIEYITAQPWISQHAFVMKITRSLLETCL